MAKLSPEELGRMHAERWNDADGRSAFVTWREKLSEEDWASAQEAFEQRATELRDEMAEADEIESAEGALLDRLSLHDSEQRSPDHHPGRGGW